MSHWVFEVEMMVACGGQQGELEMVRRVWGAGRTIMIRITIMMRIGVGRRGGFL